MELYDLLVNHMHSPVVDNAPYFSWKMSSDIPCTVQTAYCLQVEDPNGLCMDTGRVESDAQSFIPYAGADFSSGTEYTLRVTVWDNYDNTATGETRFSTGLLSENDWQAKWIECPFTREGSGGKVPVLFLRRFALSKSVRRARLYASAHGIYQVSVNGNRPDDREFAPENTSYGHFVYYQTYDVTDLVRKGDNLLCMYTADGWYFVSVDPPDIKDPHKEPSVIYQLSVEYEDGSGELIFSDGSETCTTDFVLRSDLFCGEDQDFTLSPAPEVPVALKDYGHKMLRAQALPPVVPAELIPAKEVLTTPAGETVVDFGQMVSGRARIAFDLPAGTKVTLEYFEILDGKGNYINTMTPQAPQKDTVVCPGYAFVHEALFTFHGFRYIRVTGAGQVKKEDFTAVLLTTKKDNLSDFECSDARLNRLYKNIRYSQSNNMLSVPTDCPTREKAGWTGDILIYAKTALLNEDVTAFLESWLTSVRCDQTDDGVIQMVSPYTKNYNGLSDWMKKHFGQEHVVASAGWSDAIVWVPLTMYEMTGNKKVLADNYNAMDRWCAFVIKSAREHAGVQGIVEEYEQYLWDFGFHFGEWLIPKHSETPEGRGFGICAVSAVYVAPFFGYMTVKKMAEVSRILGNEEKRAYYTDMAAKMKNAIQKGILDADRLPKDLMGAYVLAFAFDLVPEHLAEEYSRRLVGLIEENHGCLNTGFVATPFLLDSLCKIGRRDVALSLLWQTRCPSWLYEVERGATSIWEAWDGDLYIDEGRYTSFDHYAFGCVGDWIFRKMAGLDTDTPGYKHILIAPDTDCGLSHAQASFESEQGNISVQWTKKQLSVHIPCNATATVVWNGKTEELGSGTYFFE